MFFPYSMNRFRIGFLLLSSDLIFFLVRILQREWKQKELPKEWKERVCEFVGWCTFMAASGGSERSTHSDWRAVNPPVECILSLSLSLSLSHRLAHSSLPYFVL